MAASTGTKDTFSQFGSHAKDTGSPAVQVALWTDRIERITEHLKENKKDIHSRVGLLKLVGRRSRMLDYLKKTDPDQYKKVIAELNIRDK